METGSTTEFAVVTNREHRASVWPSARPLPRGWQLHGYRGSRRECLDEIGRRWSDDAPATDVATDVATGVAADVAGGRGSDTLVALFEDTATRFPDRLAVTDEGQSLTYAQLHRRTDELAGQLRGRGVAEGNLVAFHLERGVDVVVAMLGILKAGAGYVAIDARYPETRRELMLRTSRARLVITAPGEPGDRLAGVGVFGLSRQPSTAPVPPVTARIVATQPACAMFTSGSSGNPKAVVLSHRNLVHFARNAELPALTHQDRVGQVSSVSFDAFHFETWCAVAAGAAIVVLPSMAELVQMDVQRELRRQRISAMLVPTMAINHVVREDRDAFASLRILHTGGDVIQPAACRDLLEGDFAGTFCNLYGPTEATTACTAYRIEAVPDGVGSVPIGRALDGTSVRVLDGDLNEVPVGATGELHVGGAGVGWGYLGQPALTADRFLPDPFGDGERMYATGDLAQRRPDGILEFVGRIDDQVKVRGYRVEPGEVERVLCRHPMVRDAAVLAAGQGTDRHLVALVVSFGRLSTTELRRHAVQELPEFMVPSSFIGLAKLPANGHGKRDLAQLRELVDHHVRRVSERVEPRDDIERYLATLWEELLVVEQVGATDDFFLLGGNSLLMFRLQQRIARELGVPLPPSEVLSTSELAALASLIRVRKEAVTA